MLHADPYPRNKVSSRSVADKDSCVGVAVAAIYVNMTDVKTTHPLFLGEEDIRRDMELLFYAYREFTAEADVVLVDHDLGRAHHRALYFIGRNPGITVSELLAILRITKQSLARVLNDLIRLEFVVQRTGVEDRRRRHLELTDKGAELERHLMERQPARFVLRETTDFHYLEQPTTRPVPRLREAAAALAAFVGTTADALVFVDNATSGCGAVLGSLDLRPGDRILVTDHGYGAVTNAARHVAARAGAEVVTMAMPWPRFDRAAIVHAYREAITPRTRLVILDHVTSGSALVMPVEDILALARAAGARVLVDGAHAPGLLPLALDALDADWWTGNLHKWAMAPRSSAILVARADARESLTREQLELRVFGRVHHAHQPRGRLVERAAFD